MLKHTRICMRITHPKSFVIPLQIYRSSWIMSLNVRNVPSGMCARRNLDQPAHFRWLIRIVTERISDSQGCNVSSGGQRRLISLRGFVSSSGACQNVRLFTLCFKYCLDKCIVKTSRLPYLSSMFALDPDQTPQIYLRRQIRF